MNLAAYIETLEALPLTATVVFDNGSVPSRLISWRGRYNELSLDHVDDGSPPPTVGDLLRDAKQALGGTFEGYKGGDYTMGPDTPIWADPWGEYHGWAVAGFSLSNGVVTIGRFDAGDYL